MLDLFSSLPLWASVVVTLGIVLLSVEIGYRGGRFMKSRDREKDAPVGVMVGATLGLLAFLLAFTFGFAANLFMQKRDVVLEESNAIGTAYLRADFLPPEHAAAVRGLFREYVDVRIGAATSGAVGDAIRRSEEIQTQLWSHAVASMQERTDVSVGLFVQALNEVIDVHSKRVLIAVRSRVPPTIWLALYAVAFFSLGTMGYQSGLGGGRRSLAVVTVAITFTAVIALIADLDSSQEGTLRISQQSMVDLRNSMTP
jgi:Na+/proline symporter